MWYESQWVWMLELRVLTFVLANPPHRSCHLALRRSQDSPLTPGTSKLVSVPQPQVQQGPTTRRMVRRSASWMENLGRKGCQVCSTWPMVVPGGAWTSIWSGRQTGSAEPGHPGPSSHRSGSVIRLPAQDLPPPSLDHLSPPSRLPISPA